MLPMMKRAAVLIGLIGALMVPPDVSGQNSQTDATAKAADELVPIKQNGLWGYADQSGKVIIKPQFTRAGRFSEGLALVWTEGVPITDPIVKSFVKMGYIDKNGHWVIRSRFKYYFYDDFSEGLVPFREWSGKWGYMDKRGKVVIRARFDWAGKFSENVAPIQVDGRCAHVDKAGKVLDQSQIEPHWAPCS